MVTQADSDRINRSGPSGLWVAAVTALLGSLCCVGPLVLVLIGVGGAWVADLRVLDPMRPLLTVVTLFFLGWAHFRFWRARRISTCACPKGAPTGALWLWVGTVFVVIVLAAPFILPALLVPSLPRSP